MSGSDPTLERLTNQDYQYGFVTEIDSDSIPPGLNENIVRLISEKKNEPEWLLDWRLKALQRFLELLHGHLAHRVSAAHDVSGIKHRLRSFLRLGDGGGLEALLEIIQLLAQVLISFLEVSYFLAKVLEIVDRFAGGPQFLERRLRIFPFGRTVAADREFLERGDGLGIAQFAE